MNCPKCNATVLWLSQHRRLCLGCGWDNLPELSGEMFKRKPAHHEHKAILKAAVQAYLDEHRALPALIEFNPRLLAPSIRLRAGDTFTLKFTLDREAALVAGSSTAKITGVLNWALPLTEVILR